MKSILRVVALAAALSVLVAPSVATAPAEAAVARGAACANRLCTKDRPHVRSCWSYGTRSLVARCFVVRAADFYRQPRSLALFVAHRESRFDWRVTNRSSGAAGLFQFMPRTW